MQLGMRDFVSSGPWKTPQCVVWFGFFLSVLKERNYTVVYLVMVARCFAVLYLTTFCTEIP